MYFTVTNVVKYDIAAALYQTLTGRSATKMFGISSQAASDTDRFCTPRDASRDSNEPGPAGRRPIAHPGIVVCRTLTLSECGIKNAQVG
jgi:hypothetical protein